MHVAFVNTRPPGLCMGQAQLAVVSATTNEQADGELVLKEKPHCKGFCLRALLLYILPARLDLLS